MNELISAYIAAIHQTNTYIIDQLTSWRHTIDNSLHSIGPMRLSVALLVLWLLAIPASNTISKIFNRIARKAN